MSTATKEVYQILRIWIVDKLQTTEQERDGSATVPSNVRNHPKIFLDHVAHEDVVKYIFMFQALFTSDEAVLPARTASSGYLHLLS